MEMKEFKKTCANCMSILLAEVSTTLLEETKKRETSRGLGLIRLADAEVSSDSNEK